jgi:hypothetical protein
MERLFPTVAKADLGALYVGARCGLFHDGITKKGIVVEPTAPLAIEVLP